MNKKELLFIALIILGLVWTGFKFMDAKSYDCVQPIFSNLSSCTFYGADCLDQRTHPGLTGLFQQAGFFSSGKKNEFNTIPPSQAKIKCQAPGCKHTSDCYYIVGTFSNRE